MEMVAGDVAPMVELGAVEGEIDIGRWLGETIGLVDFVEINEGDADGGRICTLVGRRSFCFEFARTGSGERLSFSIS